jgi:GDP-L-fucose synthase
MTGSIEESSEAYAIAKTVGIIACRSYNRQYRTNRFIALVPNSMYGPNDNFDPESSHVLTALIRKFHDAKVNKQDKVVLWGSGNPRREFIFSEEIADASIFAMKNADKFNNSHYNIGNGVDYSIKELAYMIAEIVGYKGEMQWDTTKPDGVHKKLLNSEKFISLGWKPAISIEEGLEKTYNWFIENRNSVRVK